MPNIVRRLSHSESQRGFLIGELVGSTPPTVLTPFWVFALITYVRPVVRARRTPTAAVICWAAGAAFTLTASLMALFFSAGSRAGC